VESHQKRTRRIVAAINMTLDGFCDHTWGIVTDELHEHYRKLLDDADTVLYGRKTYQLMEYWKSILNQPTGNKSSDDFAVVMDKISKVVFSHTLKHVDWATARLTKKSLEDEALDLKGQPGGTILVGSPSLIVALTKLALIDEYQLCIHPVIAGSGLPLFKDIKDSVQLRFLKAKSIDSGATVLYYGSTGEDNQ